MRDKAYEIKMGLAAVALAGSIWGTAHSCSSYSDAMKALNANPDYVQSEILEDAADNLSSASSELEYIPPRVWTESYQTCTSYDEDGNCLFWRTHYRTHRIPADCPDPLDARSYISNAISLLQKTGAEEGANPKYAGLEGALNEISHSLPTANEMCYYREPDTDKLFHITEVSLFDNQKVSLNSAASEVNSHSEQHYAKVPDNLKSDRNWSIFGIVASILGILGTGAFGGYTVYRHKEDTGFFW